MAQLASEVLVERLAAWGVDTVFGLPGDGIDGIMEGLRRHTDDVRMVLVHHEEAAAFMATGYAKATGRIGVCLATSGPGGIHLLNGLYDAKLDHVPVLALTGSQETSLLGSAYQQEVHLEQLYADVAEYNLLITNPQQLPQAVDAAVRTAYARRLPTDVPVVGDVKEGLLAMLERRTDRSHLARYQEAMGRWRTRTRALENPERKPTAPQYPVAVLDELCADDAILTCDSGTIATWAARQFDIRGDRRFFLSGNLATMVPGLPYAIAMQHTFPGRQVVAYVGDGGFAMLMAEFLTAVRHKLPIKVVINNNNNNSFGQILWEQIVLGFPEHMVRHAPPEADFAAWAAACGGYGAKVTEPGGVRGALAEALAHPGAALVDIDVDPNEPPMPGHVTYEQAKRFTEAYLKGQPHKLSTATTLFKDKIQQLRA